MSINNKTKKIISFKTIMILLALLSIGGLLAHRFLTYKTEIKENFDIPVGRQVPLPSEEEIKGFLKVVKVSNNAAESLQKDTKKEVEWITPKTYLSTEIPILKNNKITCVYNVFLDSRVYSENQVRVKVEKAIKAQLDGKEEHKYIGRNFRWDRSDDVLIHGTTSQPATSKKLTLYIDYTIDYEKMKADNVIQEAIESNKNHLQYAVNSELITLE
ncbi:hypothetical protein [Candidatus Phytoplasma fraxini]|uniref:Effector n=1 Tax=Ash yellows phytoplasma TaxID=35780 RepID=A0ABZ2U7V5_ASHYP